MSHFDYYRLDMTGRLQSTIKQDTKRQVTNRDLFLENNTSTAWFGWAMIKRHSPIICPAYIGYEQLKK